MGREAGLSEEQLKQTSVEEQFQVSSFALLKFTLLANLNIKNTIFFIAVTVAYEHTSMERGYLKITLIKGKKTPMIIEKQSVNQVLEEF